MGTGDDATRRLKRDWDLERSRVHPQLAQEMSENTPCDRCGRQLVGGVYRLQHGHVAGALATWYVCEWCDRALVEWIAHWPPPFEISDT